MAVAFDAKAFGTATTSSAVTCSLVAGTPSGVVVALSVVDTGGATISSVTAGSKSCTLVGSQAINSFWKVFVYQTTATPDAGTQTITFNLSAGVSHGAVAQAVSVTGGDGTTPAYNFVSSAIASSNAPSQAVTCTASEGAASFCSTGNGTGMSTTPGGSATLIGNTDIGAGIGYGSYLFGTANPTLSFSNSQTLDTAIVAIAFKEASAGSPVFMPAVSGAALPNIMVTQ
jgi:hypothetical protein